MCDFSMGWIRGLSFQITFGRTRGRRVQISDKTGAGALKLRHFQPIRERGKREAGMEIGPVPGIRGLPVVKTAETGLLPPGFFDVAASAKAGDGSGQGSRKKAAGAEESDTEDLVLEGETEPGGEAREEVPVRQVDFFA